MSDDDVDHDFLDSLDDIDDGSIQCQNYPRKGRMSFRIMNDDPPTESAVKRGYTQWSTSDNKRFFPSSSTRMALIPGIYDIRYEQNSGPYFSLIDPKKESLIKFPDTNSEMVVSEIQRFWDREQQFKDFNLTQKRGILLYGPPGSGKSSTVQLVMQDVISRGGVVLNFDDAKMFIMGMVILREIQPETPVVVIMEDIDSIINNSNESVILNILDGVQCVNKVVFLATTNYINKLGPRLVNRPSRFDKQIRIGTPSEETRKVYIEHLINDKPIDVEINVEKWTKDTDGLSFAHIRELFILVVILGNEYDTAIKTVSSMKDNLEDKDPSKKFGFNH